MAATADRPWLNANLSPDARADLVLPKMTQDEKLSLVLGYFGEHKTDSHYERPALARYGSAGYVPGIDRLGIPAQWQTDAGVGVATQHDSPKLRERTSLPSGIATAATWNPQLAYQGGAMIGSEARHSGFNVMLAGGVNLTRDPRNGRQFEYAGEDPLLAGTMVGEEIRGIQSNHIISTIKHYAVNDQETGRFFYDSQIDQTAARMSDLLAFEIATAKSDPGSVMCAYNQLNGAYACENDWLLNQVLKADWGYKGYVMSDWGATHSTAAAAVAGLDQESGYIFDDQIYFGAPLKAAVAAGQVPQARLDDMVRRILRTMFARGVVDDPVSESAIDLAADAKVTQADAEEALVLLKNDHNLLPLAAKAQKIAVIGSHADVGVLSGGGSSQVYPVGGMAVPGLGPKDFPGPVVYFPSSPMKAIGARTSAASVSYANGDDPAAAAKLAAQSDLAVVFVHQWEGETLDVPLTLSGNQDALVAAVAAANPHTIVVLETGGPVLMPWLDQVGAVLEAWYPGTQGGEAIARVLFGETPPSGRLPVTFPTDLSQLPRPTLDGVGVKDGVHFKVNYSEGAAVGYKWYDKNGLKPLFPFGYGLTYTDFSYNNLKAKTDGQQITVDFDVSNTGKFAAKAVPQIYVGAKTATWEAPRRLAGWSKLELAPGEKQHVTLTAPARLLATFDTTKGWSIAPGQYEVCLAASSRDIKSTATVTLTGGALPLSLLPK